MFCWSKPDDGGVVPGSCPFGRFLDGKVFNDKRDGMVFPPELEFDESGSNPGPGVPFGNMTGDGPLGSVPPFWGKTGKGPIGPGTPFILVITDDPGVPLDAITGESPGAPLGVNTVDGALTLTEGWGNTGCWNTGGCWAVDDTGAEDGSATRIHKGFISNS